MCYGSIPSQHALHRGLYRILMCLVVMHFLLNFFFESCLGTNMDQIIVLLKYKNVFIKLMKGNPKEVHKQLSHRCGKASVKLTNGFQSKKHLLTVSVTTQTGVYLQIGADTPTTTKYEMLQWCRSVGSCLCTELIYNYKSAYVAYVVQYRVMDVHKLSHISVHFLSGLRLICSRPSTVALTSISSTTSYSSSGWAIQRHFHIKWVMKTIPVNSRSPFSGLQVCFKPKDKF